MSKMQPPRSRLGRGLNALISLSDPVVQEVPPASEPTSSAATNSVIGESKREDAKPEVQQPTQTPIPPGRVVVEIPLDQISVNPHQPRKQMDQATLAQLAASLKSNGLIQPILVRKVDGGYQLIAGERRYRASQLAGLSHVLAIVREVDSFTQAQLALVENIHREDLNPIDRASAYQSLITQLGLTQAELASRLGEERSSIANYVRLLDLVPSVRDLVRLGTLSLGHAKILAGVADSIEQERLANLVVGQQLSVRNLERLLNDKPVDAKAKSGGATPHQKELEVSLARQLGVRVQVRGQGKKGRVVLHYASLDQFDELMRRIGVSVDEG